MYNALARLICNTVLSMLKHIVYFIKRSKGEKMIKLKATTVSPLRQIDKTENDVIRVKRGTFLIDFDGITKTLKTPIFTANGLRGILRREATAIMLEAAEKNGISINGATNFHLMNAGGGNNFQAQAFDIENKVRALNPLVSLLGTSLAVRGKLSVSDLIPKRLGDDGMSLCYGISEDGRIYSNITQVEAIIKEDAALSRSPNSRFLSEEEIIEWELAVSDNQSQRAATKDKSGDAKVKKMSIKHIQSRESVVAGVDFYSSIVPIDGATQITDIEKGLLVRAVERVVKRAIGSNFNTGNGKMNYEVTLFEDSTIVAKYDDEFDYKVNVETNYNKEVKSYCKAFDTWAADMTEESIQLDKILV